MVIDCHIHLMCQPGETQAAAVTRMLACIDRLGIDQVCVSLGSSLVLQPTAAQLREQNEWAGATVALAPERIRGFVYCSPNHPELSLELLDEYVVQRRAGGAAPPFVGVKLWVCQLADHPGNDPICRRAAELGLPVLAHTWHKTTGNYDTESRAEHLVALARRHPDVNFIMAHAGGDWERGLRAVRHVPNIYPDTCGNDPEAGFVELGVRLLGARRLVFGSDATGRSFASQMAKITGASVSSDDKALILGGNLERLMPA